MSTPLADEREGSDVHSGEASRSDAGHAVAPAADVASSGAVASDVASAPAPGSGSALEGEAASPAEAGAAPPSEQAEETAAPAGPTPGEQLRAERERQGLSVGEVARQLKLATRQVEALESDDHASLPGSVFVRGFLRNYARALGLDADALVRQAFGGNEPPPPPGAPVVAVSVPPAAPPDKQSLNVPVESGAPRRRGMTPWVVGGALVAVFVVGAVVLLAGRGPARSPSTEVAVSPAPAQAPAADAAAQASPVAAESPAATAEAAASPGSGVQTQAARDAEASLTPSRPEPAPESAVAAESSPATVIGSRGPEMRFSFSRESWVEIRDGDGRVIYSQLNPGGSERVVRGKPPLELVVGNASGVALAYRGKSVDLGPHTRTDVARLTLE